MGNGLFLIGGMSLEMQEAIAKQREIVAYMDRFMLSEAQLLCTGNRASAMKLKKGKPSFVLFLCLFCLFRICSCT